MPKRLLLVGGLIVSLFCGWIPAPGRTASALTLTITDPGQGVFPLPAGSTDATELSGLTYQGGNQYYAVSDSSTKVYPLVISSNSATGWITSAVLGSGVVLATGTDTDLEGVAYQADGPNQYVYVSDEGGNNIRKFDLSDGSLVQTTAPPSVFANARTNHGLESLSLRAGGQRMWTANEEALTVDGDVSSASEGTRVRLVRYNWNSGSSTWDNVAQYAYKGEPITSSVPVLTEEFNSLSEMLVLPNGKLLAQERQADLVGLSVQFRNRIYEVDYSTATDINSNTAGLSGLTEGVDYTPVTKSLLWEETFPTDNFEGMALGPQLDDGSYALLLISDDGSYSVFSPDQSLYTLKLSGEVPEPSTLVLLCMGAVGLLGYAWRKRRRRR